MLRRQGSADTGQGCHEDRGKTARQFHRTRAGSRPPDTRKRSGAPGCATERTLPQRELRRQLVCSPWRAGSEIAESSVIMPGIPVPRRKSGRHRCGNVARELAERAHVGTRRTAARAAFATSKSAAATRSLAAALGRHGGWRHLCSVWAAHGSRHVHGGAARSHAVPPPIAFSARKNLRPEPSALHSPTANGPAHPDGRHTCTHLKPSLHHRIQRLVDVAHALIWGRSKPQRNDAAGPAGDRARRARSTSTRTPAALRSCCHLRRRDLPQRAARAGAFNASKLSSGCCAPRRAHVKEQGKRCSLPDRSSPARRHEPCSTGPRRIQKNNGWARCAKRQLWARRTLTQLRPRKTVQAGTAPSVVGGRRRPPQVITAGRRACRPGLGSPAGRCRHKAQGPRPNPSPRVLGRPSGIRRGTDSPRRKTCTVAAVVARRRGRAPPRPA